MTQQTTAATREALRQRYTVVPVPKCSICGEEMTIRAYEDRQVCWECQDCCIYSRTLDGDVAVLAAIADADLLDDALSEIKILQAALTQIVVVVARGDAEEACNIAFIAGCSPEMRIAMGGG
jgi:hypothetical protein